jgi:hypothetical protein
MIICMYTLCVRVPVGNHIVGAYTQSLRVPVMNYSRSMHTQHLHDVLQKIRILDLYALLTWLYV